MTTSLVGGTEFDDFFAKGQPGGQAPLALPLDQTRGPDTLPASVPAVTPAPHVDAPTGSLARETPPIRSPHEFDSMGSSPSDVDLIAVVEAVTQMARDLSEAQGRGDLQVERLEHFVGKLLKGQDALGLKEAAARIAAAADGLAGPLQDRLLRGDQDADKGVGQIVTLIEHQNEQLRLLVANNQMVNKTILSAKDEKGFVATLSRQPKWVLLSGGGMLASMLLIVGAVAGASMRSPATPLALQEEVLALRQQVNTANNRLARYQSAVSEIVGAGNSLAWFYNCPPDKRPRVANGGQSNLCAFTMTKPFEVP